MDWQAWFHRFESAMITNGVPLEKCIDLLDVHTSADLLPVVPENIDICKRNGVSLHDIYAIVRHEVLLRKVNCLPMTFSNQ